MLHGLFRTILNAFFVFLRVSENTDAAGYYPEPFTPEEEVEAFKRLRQGDNGIREELIMRNMRLAIHIVKKYNTAPNDVDEYVSDATLGLMKAVDTYNYENGIRFATYAGKCIQNEILMHFRVSKHISAEIPIDQPIERDKDDNMLTIEDLLGTEDTIAEDIYTRDQIIKAIKIMKEELKPREREIIVRRYGLGGCKPQTQKEIAADMEISRSYVSRIETAVLNKMREKI